MANPSRRALLGAALGLSFSSFETGPFGFAQDMPRPARPLLRVSGEGEGIPDQVRDDEGTPPPAFASGCGGSPSPSLLGEDWQAALDAFEAAAGEVRGFEARCRGRPFEEQEALQGEYDARGEAMDSALRRLLLAPAPDVAALARKIELAFAFEIEPLSSDEPCLAAIRCDARRLAQAGTVG